MRSIEKPTYYHYLLLLILIYLVIFLKIDSFHMRWWDESMFAVNTYEMGKNGNYFSLYFNGIPDLLNTKPPLTNWFQLVFVKIIGFSELACRLPSAIAAAATVLVLFGFVNKQFGLIWAWCSALILLSSFGFISFHTARTADSDALLTVFLFAANIYFLKYLSQNKQQDILYFLIFITLAFATKHYAAFLFGLAYIALLILHKRIIDFIFNKYFIVGMMLLVGVSALLMLVREMGTPGYLKQILLMDAGRMFKVVEQHNEPFQFYLENLFKSRFSIWSVLLTIGGVFAFFSREEQEKKTLSSMIILIVGYWFVISFSQTKLEWYDTPLYPLMAILAAYPIVSLFKLKDENGSHFTLKTALFLLAIFMYPYVLMFNKSQANTIPLGEKKLEAKESFIYKEMVQHKKLNSLKVYYTGYCGSLLFYKYKLAEQNQNIELNTTAAFEVNDKVLVSDDSLVSVLKLKYSFDLLDKRNEAQLIQIKQIL